MAVPGTSSSPRLALQTPLLSSCVWSSQAVLYLGIGFPPPQMARQPLFTLQAQLHLPRCPARRGLCINLYESQSRKPSTLTLAQGEETYVFRPQTPISSGTVSFLVSLHNPGPWLLLGPQDKASCCSPARLAPILVPEHGCPAQLESRHLSLSGSSTSLWLLPPTSGPGRMPGTLLGVRE